MNKGISEQCMATENLFHREYWMVGLNLHKSQWQDILLDIRGGGSNSLFQSKCIVYTHYSGKGQYFHQHWGVMLFLKLRIFFSQIEICNEAPFTQKDLIQLLKTPFWLSSTVWHLLQPVFLLFKHYKGLCWWMVSHLSAIALRMGWFSADKQAWVHSKDFSSLFTSLRIMNPTGDMHTQRIHNLHLNETVLISGLSFSCAILND